MVSRIIEEAKHLGFVAVGFCKPQRPPFFDHFCDWITSGKHGEMVWMDRHKELRADPGGLLEGCRTLISLAFPYPATKPVTPDGYRAARFSEPHKADYHDRMRELGRKLARMIDERFQGSKSRILVDSAPIMERSFAYAAGIGFIGKNNILIVPEHGSYLFLVEILTTASLSFRRAEPMGSCCGPCNRCVEACPTGALEKPYSIDATKCLSYLTIEYEGELDAETGRKTGGCFFGCDVCQEVCPFNNGKALEEVQLPLAKEILGMKEAEFKERFGKSIFARLGLEKLKRNIMLCLRARAERDAPSGFQ